MKLRIGLVLGDPCGVGPELVAKLVASPQIVDQAAVVVIGDRRVLAMGESVSGTRISVPVIKHPEELPDKPNGLCILDLPAFDPKEVEIGKQSAASGAWQLACLSLALDLCTAGKVDGFCFGPLNKEAMRLGGLKYEDEQGFFAEKLGVDGPIGMMNTLGHLWTSRVTSHVAFKDVSNLISEESVLKAIMLADTTLRNSGIAAPRIAVAGLNPHAGEGGFFGYEEKNKILPAIKQAQEKGVKVVGPFPADTIFLKGRDGVYDVIVTMYHDQGQIAMKLMGFDDGVTVHCGLPYPITTSAHGTAFDIAGRGVANPQALRAAFNIVCSMAAKN